MYYQQRWLRFASSASGGHKFALTVLSPFRPNLNLLARGRGGHGLIMVHLHTPCGWFSNHHSKITDTHSLSSAKRLPLSFVTPIASELAFLSLPLSPSERPMANYFLASLSLSPFLCLYNDLRMKKTHLTFNSVDRPLLPCDTFRC